MTTDVRHREMTLMLPRFYDDAPEAAAIMRASAEEVEDTRFKARELLAQFSAITATWGLSDWERVLELPPRPNSSAEARRMRILAKLRGTQPATIANMLAIINAHVPDKTASIVELPEPGVFDVVIPMQDLLTFSDLRSDVYTYKPAHLKVLYRLIDEIVLSQKISNRVDGTVKVQTTFNPWAFAGGFGDGAKRILLDGQYQLDGERHLNSFVKTNGPAYISDTRLVIQVLHDFGIHEVSIAPILDGEYRLDGQMLMQNDLQKVKVAVLQEAKIREKLSPKIAVDTTLAIATKSRMKTTSNPWAFAGGGFGSESIRLDGKYKLNADRFMNGYYNVDGPVYSVSKRFYVKAVNDFGTKVSVNQEIAMRCKERELIVLAPKQGLTTLCSLNGLSGVSTLNGANDLMGVISLNQAVFEHNGLFRVKKSGVTVEEVAV